MRIIHFSDTHEAGTPESAKAFFDKRLVGFLNCKLARGRLHSQALLELAVARFLELKPELLLCTGDLTTSGQPGEFKRALKRLKPLLDSGAPLLYLPGNHDAYVRDAICRKALEAAFETLNRGRFKLEDMPAAFDIGCVRMMAVDCARPTLPFLSCGFMDAESSAFVRAECEASREAGRPFRLLAGHFPLLERHPWRRIRHKLYGHDAVARLLKTKALDLSLCGHVHKPYALLDGDGRGEICAGSLTRYGSYSVLELDERAGTIVHKSESLLSD
jgi:DNA repair exonuclease SbcCD nuclease subunit